MSTEPPVAEGDSDTPARRTDGAAQVIPPVEGIITLGTRVAVPLPESGDGPLIVFEDDGSTGYAYACLRLRERITVLEAWLLYDAPQPGLRGAAPRLTLSWIRRSSRAWVEIHGLVKLVVDFPGRWSMQHPHTYDEGQFERRRWMVALMQ